MRVELTEREAEVIERDASLAAGVAHAENLSITHRHLPGDMAKAG